MVKVPIWMPQPPSAAGVVAWDTRDLDVPAAGLPVNLFIGPTGTGKTSCIQMMAGGSPTVTDQASHTKSCGLYEITDPKGEKYCILDSVGLLDTASTSDQRKAFLDALLKFVKDNNLNVCQIFFTVPLGGKIMAEAVHWISAAIQAFGDANSVSLVTSWLLTKYNMDSKFNRRTSQADIDSPTGTFQTMKTHAMGYDVVFHGEENEAELFAKMVPMGSRKRGLAHADMTQVEHHENMVKNYKSINTALTNQKESLDSLRSDADFQREMAELRERIDQASVDLANCGKSKKKKQQYRDIIQNASSQLAAASRAMQSTGATREQKKEQMKKLNESLKAQLEVLEKRENLLEKMADLAGVAADAAPTVLGLMKAARRA